MLRVTKSVAAILLGLGLVGILPTAVIAWNATCDQFEVCVWKHGPFGSPKAADSDTEWDYTPDHYPNTTEDINDSVSSIRNLKNKDAIWFWDAGYKGNSYCLRAGYEQGYLGGHNDRFSSHLIAADDDACQ